jgi:hypothetical protein
MLPIFHRYTVYACLSPNFLRYSCIRRSLTYSTYITDLSHKYICDLSSISHRYSCNTGRSLTYIAEIEDESLSVSWLGVPSRGRGDLYKGKMKKSKQKVKKNYGQFTLWLEQEQGIIRRRTEASIRAR